MQSKCAPLNIRKGYFRDVFAQDESNVCPIAQARQIQTDAVLRIPAEAVDKLVSGAGSRSVDENRPITSDLTPLAEMFRLNPCDG